ncbi:hypothetical protein, partial [Segatella oulorum]|uniref:hypothetical protein n=1 Tax=Segatella oulorum TaxID=28136 RepID=UPI0018C8CB07
CWSSSKAEKSKEAAGVPARLKNQKTGCWSSSKAEKSKRWAAGVPARLKNQKDGLLEFQQG